MTNREQNFTATVIYPFQFIGVNDAGETQTTPAPLTTTITTEKTIFPYAFTQTWDPFSQGRVKTATSQVTLNSQGSQVISSSSISSNSTASVTAASSSGTPTTTSSATTSTSASPQPAPSPGISTGAAAGVGIGCAIAGAAIAAVLVFFLLRRKQRPHVTRSTSRGPTMRSNTYGSGDNGMTHGGTMMASMNKSAPIATVDRALEPPLQDSDILSSVQRLGTAIKNYAQSYHARGGSLTGGANVSAEQLSTLLGPDALVHPQELAALLTSPQSRTAAVRFIIAWCVLRGTDGNAETSLLPPELAQCLEVIHSGRSNVKGEENPVQSDTSIKYSLLTTSDAERSLMLSRWRQMTAALMREAYDTDDISSADRRRRNVRDLANRLNAVLAPIASSNRGSDADRRENLEELVKRGAKLAYMLFTQPTEWAFSWDEPTGQQGDLVVFPRLLRTADETGMRQGQPHSHGAAQVVDTGVPRARAR